RCAQDDGSFGRRVWVGCGAARRMVWAAGWLGQRRRHPSFFRARSRRTPTVLVAGFELRHVSRRDEESKRGPSSARNTRASVGMTAKTETCEAQGRERLAIIGLSSGAPCAACCWRFRALNFYG